MSMSPEQENFDGLRRLLTLKRHEQPPPGYFRDFSGHVIARIRAGERADRGGFWESLSWEAPWLQRLWGAFETKPIMAGALGMAVCALLVSGIALSERSVNPNVASLDSGKEGQAPVTLALQATSNPLSSLSSSTAGIAPDQATPALFDGLKVPAAVVANWPLGNGN